MRKKFIFALIIGLCFFVLTSCWGKVEVKFDSRGGTSVPTITDKDDFDANNLPVPAKEGHTFLGWYLDSDYKTPIVGNVPKKLRFTLYAKWEVNSYTIRFHTNGGNEIPNQAYLFGAAISAPPAPTKEGNTFQGWYEDENLSKSFTFTTMPAKDLDLYAKWGKESYTITFDSKGGSEVSPITAEYGAPIAAPANPVKTGYEFAGWYLDEAYTTHFTFATMPLNGATLYAKWDKASFKLIYHSNGGTEIPESVHLFGDAISEPSAPSKEGYEFAGWYTDASLTTAFVFSTMPAHDVNLYAKWTPKTYTITFDSQGGSLVEPISAGYGTAIQLPTPEKAGHVFVGWFLDENYTQSFTSATMPLGGAHLYAKWVLEPNSLTFVTGFEDLTVSPLEAYPGEPITLPTPQYMGYEFAGWFLEETFATEFTAQVMPEENITLYAKWTPQLVTYTVLHYAEDPEIEGMFAEIKTEVKQAYTGTTVQAVLLTEGLTEITDHPNRVVSGTVKGDGSLMLYVYYSRNTYTITVYGDGGIDDEGSEVVIISAKYGSTITSPVFTKKGYRFTGWSTVFPEAMPYYDLDISACWEAVYVNYKVEHYQENAENADYTLTTAEIFSALIDHEVEATIKTFLGFTVNTLHPESKHSGITLENDALVLKVYYKRNVYEISFRDSDGNPLDIPAISAKFEAPITAPSEPTKEGYTFLGWFVSLSATEPFEFTTMPLGGATLYAKYQVRLYKITFVSYAEIGVTEITAEYGTPINPPSDPIRQGYTFKGWYLDEETTIPYEFTVMPAEDITLYAKWEPNQVTVTFVYLDGRANTVVTGSVGSQLEEISPTRDGYSFEGWYKDNQFTDKFTDFTFPVTSIYLYALWEPLDYTIEFVTGIEGVEVDPITAPYNSRVDLPVPVAEGFKFLGWYTDPETTVLFEEHWMPLGGITLYAKWTESAEEFSIAYALEQEPGTLVSVKGIVFAKVQSPYGGFYIKDANNQIFCFAEQEIVNIGDELLITGYFDRWNNAPVLFGITDGEILSSDNPVTPSIEMTIDDLEAIDPWDENYGLHIVLTGVLINKNGQLYLVSLESFKEVLIFHQSYDRFDIAFEAGEMYTGEFVLRQYDYSSGWSVSLIEDTLELIPLTDEEKAGYIKTYLESLGSATHYPLDSFVVPTTDPFGWSTVQATLKPESEPFYDQNNKVFADSEEPYEVLFAIMLTVGEYTETFDLTVSVTPYPIITIYDFYQTEDLGVYFLQGTVIFDYDGWVILQDETGTFEFDLWDFDFKVEIGWEVVIKYDDYNYDYYTIELLRVLSTNNQPPEALKLTEADLLERETDFNYLYQGQYVELRGFFSYRFEDYYWSIEPSIKVGNTVVSICDFKSMLGETFPFNNLEVIMRGYLYYNYYDGWLLYFLDNRGDFQIPSYSPLELVAALQSQFINIYQDYEFHSLTSFDLPSSHPILGGTITWKMASGYESYYDFENNRFVEVSEPTPISIEITISYNDVNVSFTINTLLYPEEVVQIAELTEISDDETVTVKGLVIYKWYEWFYLMDDTGIIMVSWYENTVQKGDYVRLTGQKQTRDYVAYIECKNDDSTIEIIFTDNPIDIPITPMTLTELIKTEPGDINLINYYFEIKGRINMDGGDRLYYGEKFVYIFTPDTYTRNELNAYNGKDVVIRVYLDDYYYWDRTWSVRFTGLPGEIEEVTLTDEEKLACVKSVLEERFSRPIQSGSYFGLDYYYHPYDVYIDYEKITDEFNCFDLVTLYLNPIPEDSEIEIIATITLGDLQESVPLTLKALKVGTDSEIPLVTIAEFKESNGEMLRVEGTIVDIYSLYVLIEDETGVLFVRSQSFQYSYNYFINRKIIFTGQLNIYRGRKEMIYLGYEDLNTYGSSEVYYEPITLAEIVSLDPYADSVYGRPVEITGIIYREWDNYSYDFQFYLTDGFDKVRLENYYYLPGQYIGYLEGLEVTVKGRILGIDPYFWGEDVWTVELARIPVETKGFSDQETVDFIKETLVSNYDNTVYTFLDYLYFDFSQYSFPAASVHFEILSGEEAIDFYGYSGYFQMVEEDTEIVFRVTVICNEAYEEFTLTITLHAMDLSTYEDIFDEEGGFKRLYLKGVMLYEAPDGVYFLIDGNVYFLANVLEGSYYYEGSEYLLTGYRATIDGKTDIWLNAEVVYELGYYYDDYPEPETITIQEIYAKDYRELLKGTYWISGTLGYDKASDLYYLENMGERIYLRVAMQKESKAGEMGVRNGYLPEYLFGRSVIVKSLFPGKTIKGKYLFDVFGDLYNAIIEPEYTPAQIVDNVVDYLIRYFQNEPHYSFGGITFEEYLDNCQLTWELINPEDAKYFYDVGSGIQGIIWLEEPVTVSFNVTITLEEYDMEPISKTITLDMSLNPREVITIEEMLRRGPGKSYTVKGIVYEVNQEFGDWIIIKDETGMLKVNVYGTYYDGCLFEVGNEVVVYGYYSYRDYEATPNISYASEIAILSWDNEITHPSATVYSIEEIFALDYLDLSIGGTYVTTTGYLIKSGNNYYLYNEKGQEIELLWAYDKNFDASATLYDYVGYEVQITGYLMGLISTQASPPRWCMTVRDLIIPVSS